MNDLEEQMKRVKAALSQRAQEQEQARVVRTNAPAQTAGGESRPDRDGVTPLAPPNVVLQQVRSTHVGSRAAAVSSGSSQAQRPPIRFHAPGADEPSGDPKVQVEISPAKSSPQVAAPAQNRGLPSAQAALPVTRPAAAKPAAKAAQPVPAKPLPVPCVFSPLPKTSATRKGLFRMPEAWVGRGGKAQWAEHPSERGMDIIIGLDFGTSFTKAAVGMLDKIFPVSWEGVSSCAPKYLLPSEYSSLEDGKCFIGQHSNARLDQIHGDLKLPFINNAVSAEDMDRAVTFLGLVLRYVRAWVYERHGSKLGRSTIRWHLNLGAPSNGLENAGLVEQYKVLGATAWQRSLSVDPLRLLFTGTNTWRAGEALDGLFPPYVCPEFVAQMAGYMKSPQRQRGLHALVDVGGGTLDVVTFIVHSVEEEDTFPFLIPEVKPLGTHGLLQNRLVGSQVPAQLTLDELAPVPDAPAFADSLGVAKLRVEERDGLFVHEVRSLIQNVFHTTRQRRYRLSDAWKYGVRTFFTGGGSYVSTYDCAIRTARIPSSGGLSLAPLPPHPRLDEFDGGAFEYQRISVACGLAQDVFSLGRVVPAREVADDEAVVLPQRRRDDRDELYPK